MHLSRRMVRFEMETSLRRLGDRNRSSFKSETSMNRTVILAFAISTVLATNGFTQGQTESSSVSSASDSLMHRIRSTKHVGVRTDERLSGYVLYLYTPTQHAQNLGSLTAYRKDLEMYNAQIESLNQKRREAQERRALSDELNAITQEMNRIRRPDSTFARSIFLYNVVHFGVDYIELSWAETPGDPTLIPLSRICKIIVTSTGDSQTDEPSDEPKSR